MKNIKVGTCGLRLAKPKYAALFPVAEVQHTFYEPPKIATLEAWRNAVPDDFEFTVKAWQLITHESKSPTYRRLKRKLTAEELGEVGAFKDTPIVHEAWETMKQCLETLRAQRVLFQCPPSFDPTEEHLEHLRHFFQTVDRKGLICMWEPRGKGWTDDLVRELCSELNLIHVVDPFSRQTVTPRDPYYRLHGRGSYSYTYEDSELEDLYEMLPGAEVSYVLFNNVRMVTDAQRFLALIAKREKK